jgi:hypothetical protein
VRSLQRRYTVLWTGVLACVRPEVAAGEWAVRLPAAFGLLNATPHLPADRGGVDAAELLAAMALDALLGPGERPAAVTQERPAPAAAAG